MSKVFIDSSVLVGALSPTDALHESSIAAIETWERRGAEFGISTVTWSEVLTGELKRGERSQEEFEETIDETITDVLLVDKAIGTRAAYHRLRHKGVLPDALIIASAREYDADVLLSGDKGMKNAAPDLVELVSP